MALASEQVSKKQFMISCLGSCYGSEKGKTLKKERFFFCCKNKQWCKEKTCWDNWVEWKLLCSLSAIVLRFDKAKIHSCESLVLTLCAELLNDLSSFDVNSMSWESIIAIPSRPSPRYGHGFISVENKLYVFGSGSKTSKCTQRQMLQFQRSNSSKHACPSLSSNMKQDILTV